MYTVILLSFLSLQLLYSEDPFYGETELIVKVIQKKVVITKLLSKISSFNFKAQKFPTFKNYDAYIIF